MQSVQPTVVHIVTALDARTLNIVEIAALQLKGAESRECKNGNVWLMST